MGSMEKKLRLVQFMSVSSKSSSKELKKSASASLFSPMTPSAKLSSVSTSSTSMAMVEPWSSMSPKKSIGVGLMAPNLLSLAEAMAMERLTFWFSAGELAFCLATGDDMSFPFYVSVQFITDSLIVIF
ncbi:unnamed protein product [Prunus brigantina]